MSRLLCSLAAALAATALLAPSASADFGLKDLEVSFLDSEGTPSLQAGSHPFEMRTSLNVNVDAEGEPEGAVKDLIVDLPPGLIGDPFAVPRCSNADFLAETPADTPACPDSTAVGYIAVRTPLEGKLQPTDFAAVYNLNPPPGVAAKLGFRILKVSVPLHFGMRTGGERNLYASLANTPQAEPFYGSELVVWGNPADPAHDDKRGECALPGLEKSCPVSVPERPFLTLPRSCEGSLVTTFRARSWQEPGRWVSDAAGTAPGTVGCESLGFEAEISSRATTTRAASASGLEFDLGFKDEGLTSTEGTANSDLGAIEVALPEGMTLNPSQAEGLEACSQAELDREGADSRFGSGCPAASKVGTVRATTPILEGEVLEGDVFVAEPYRNPFGSLVAIYLVIRSPERGILVTQAGKVSPDPRTGQLVSTFADLPPVPLEQVTLRLSEGARSPLITPPRCGRHETRAQMSPSADPSSEVTDSSAFELSFGPEGRGCPGPTPPLVAGLAAGTSSNQAGAHSPFLLRLTRRDGDQDIVRFDAKLPPGLVAKLAGTAWCPEAAIAAAKGRDGKDELADPSCPAASRIGSALAGAGVGSQLTYVEGSVYLAGPYGGAPLSVVGVVPAVAGPFDVGTVVVRQALRVDPRTAEVTVDGALSDPIPHILAGIPLAVRDIRVAIDRPQFTLNPTNCDPMAIFAGIWGGGADPFSGADDAPVPIANRYQAASCGALGFSPRLGIRLKGKTRRGGHPALRATYVPKPGDANVKRLALTFPNSEFVENANFKTICTRVQYAAGPGGGALCPPGSIYGQVTAYTPLLAQPLEGPVFLRSSDNLLPDAVFALRGLIDAEVAVRIDSKRGRLRATVTSAPDVPVSKVIVQMRGGNKGLFVNSRNICRGANRARVNLLAQSAKKKTLRPRLRAQGCGGKKRKKGAKRKR